MDSKWQEKLSSAVRATLAGGVRTPRPTSRWRSNDWNAFFYSGYPIYFGKNPKTLFVNVQHSAATDGDGTWAIIKAKK